MLVLLSAEYSQAAEAPELAGRVRMSKTGPDPLTISAGEEYYGALLRIRLKGGAGPSRSR